MLTGFRTQDSDTLVGKLYITLAMPSARGPRNQSAYPEGLVILLQSTADTLVGRETRHTKRDLEADLRLEVEIHSRST